MEANKSSNSFNQRSAQLRPNEVQETGTGAGGKAPLSFYGPGIAQSALQGIGMSTRSPYGPGGAPPQYAKAVSILFSNATGQKIMVDKRPQDVVSTTHLWMYLKHDNRFRQVPMSEAAPGDVIVEAHVRDANGYAGIIVDHGRIVANSFNGVRINSSLADHRGSYPPMAAFRYMGVPGPLRTPLANAGFNEDEPRLPAGQPGGGQWTSGGATPSITVVSGGNNWAPGGGKSDLPVFDMSEYLGDVAEMWKGYGDSITGTVLGLWNVLRHPVSTAKGVAAGVSQLAKDPAGTLKAIGQQIARDFTDGDPRKAGRLIGQALIALAGTGVTAEQLASLLPKVEAAAAGEAVSFTPEETEIVQRVMSGEELRATEKEGLIRGGRTDMHHVTDAAGNDALRARQRLSLKNTPEYKATLEVQKGKFSPPTRVEPHNKMPGGGMERTAEGKIPVRIVKFKKLK